MKQPKDYQRKHEPFRFRLGTGTYTLPTDLSVKAMASLVEAEGLGPSAMIDTLQDIAPGEAIEAVVSMPILDFKDLMSDWMTALGAGESGNSDGSSTS